MIHIVFQRNDAEVLKKAFELDASLQGDVIRIEDEFAVGPLADIYTAEGIEARKQWWREILAGGGYDGFADNGATADDNVTVSTLQQRLFGGPQEIARVQAGQNT